MKTQTKEKDGFVYVVRYGFDTAFAARNNQAPYLSVTGEVWTLRNWTAHNRGNPRADSESCGVLHEMIAEQFPDLLPLLPFHLCGTDGPMHYPANALYLAGGRDCWGLLAGERRQIGNRWELRIDDGTPHGADLPGSWSNTKESDERPSESFILRWFPYCRVGEGKPRQLTAARAAACWPDATDAELIAATAETYAARLPGLLARMRAACATCGVDWPE